jgi:hypothetical protein
MELVKYGTKTRTVFGAMYLNCVFIVKCASTIYIFYIKYFFGSYTRESQ